MYVVYFSKMDIFLIILFITLIVLIIKRKYDNNKKQVQTNLLNHNPKVQTDIEKGKVGEDEIVDALEKIDIYHKIIRNVYITNNSKKTEIDVIYITTCGLFIIESKNFKGNIYGYDYNEKWIQYFNEDKKYNFPNPIIQNNYHIDFLYNKLKLAKKEYFKSYIVFGEHAKLRAINLTKFFDVKVINTKDLIENIIDDIHNSPIVLSHEEIDKIYIDLQYYCMHLNR